jgi:hypothetical protein
MKNFFIGTMIILSAGMAVAQGFQTPAQQSAGAIKAVLNAVLADKGLMLKSITKISHSNANRAKVEFTDNDGNCSALSYEISYSPLGIAMSAKLDTRVVVVCDN